MQLKNWNRLLLLLLIWILAGCVPETSVRPSLDESNDPLIMQAEALALAGDHATAADIFEQAAKSRSDRGLRQQLLLRAAESRFLAADTEAATRLLEQIRVDDLPLLDFQRKLLVAEMALARNRPDEALTLLEAVPPEGTRLDQRRRFHRNRAEAFRFSGNLLERGRELEQLDLLISDQHNRLENQLAIVQTYAALTDNALLQLQPPPPDPHGGWLALTRIIKTFASDEKQIEQQFAAWRKSYPGHPVMEEFLDGYFKRLKAQYRRLNHLAVLLPESGPYARAASWLRDGLLAAYYQNPPEARTKLRFYDSSSPESTWPLYQQAVESGADMVIGPLNKESVAQLSRAGELDIPVLALNQVAPTGLPSPDLFQFALSPEDEARQVAERAWTDGHTIAVVLTPAGDWGDRIAARFRQRWESLGGVVAEQQQYDNEQHDFSEPIQQLFNLDRSLQRHGELQNTLGRKLEFEPRRRQDAGFIFLAAKPQKARQIRPQLQFHHAADLPIYTTSHVFSGIAAADKDRDLNGIRFPMIPWLLTGEDEEQLSLNHLLRAFPDTPARYLPLLAMGIDGMQLLPHLARLQSSPNEVLQGKTGNLFMDSGNRVHRQMLWAEIVEGVPQVTGFSPRLDTGIGAFPEAPADDPDALPPTRIDPGKPAIEVEKSESEG
jgi:hypothetical protein